MNGRLPESSRLLFRCWTEEDLPLARSLWTDPGVMGHMGGPMSEDEVRARLALEMERKETVGVQYWPMFLRETGEFAGCSGLRPWKDEPVCSRWVCTWRGGSGARGWVRRRLGRWPDLRLRDWGRGR